MENLKLDKLQVSMCNRCSKEIQSTNIESNLMHNFSVNFGYGSDYDMTKWKFTLCEKCLFDFILTFQITPLSEEGDSLG